MIHQLVAYLAAMIVAVESICRSFVLIANRVERHMPVGHVSHNPALG